MFRIDELLEVADTADLHESPARRTARHGHVGRGANDGLEMLGRTCLDHNAIDNARAADRFGQTLRPEARRDDDLLDALLRPRRLKRAGPGHAEHGEREYRN